MSTTVPQGPEPTILNRKQIDALYETFEAIKGALATLNVRYIVTGGSLLGAIRQHSILFCDDDIDITIIDDHNGEAYKKVSNNLASLLGKDYMYSKRPWEGGDKVRPKRMSNVFVDIFTLRQYNSIDDLVEVIGIKKNGLPQSEEYVQSIVKTIEENAFSQNECEKLCPFWHFNERKAIEMWPKEVYRTNELFPLCTELKFGPFIEISGPRMPVLLLKRAFGADCFEVYYQSGSHNNMVVKNKAKNNKNSNAATKESSDATEISDGELKPIILEGGNWSSASKVPLSDEHYLPNQPISRAKRRYTKHNRDNLIKYIEVQSKLEEEWIRDPITYYSSEGIYD